MAPLKRGLRLAYLPFGLQQTQRDGSYGPAEKGIETVTWLLGTVSVVGTMEVMAPLKRGLRLPRAKCERKRRLPYGSYGPAEKGIETSRTVYQPP